MNGQFTLKLRPGPERVDLEDEPAEHERFEAGDPGAAARALACGGEPGSADADDDCIERGFRPPRRRVGLRTLNNLVKIIFTTEISARIRTSSRRILYTKFGFA